MSAEDDAAGAKREREEDPADADDAPAAKEARVDAEAPADASADPAANAEDAPAGDAPAGDAPAQEEANAPAAPAPSATLTEALDLLAPKVTKRLENLHASGSVAEGEIDAATLAELGEFSPAQAVDTGRQMAVYVSEHSSLPSLLKLEFERVLCPMLLDSFNNYAGAEWTRGVEETAAAASSHAATEGSRHSSPFPSSPSRTSSAPMSCAGDARRRRA